MFRAYYDSEGNLTTIGKSNDPGDYVEIDQTTFEIITQAPHKWKVFDKKIKQIEELENKPPKKYKIVDSDGVWVVKKDNLFYCNSYATIKPDWFEDTKHSWVKYD